MNLDTSKTKVWFTSDLHLFHKNILKFNPDTRDGENENQMSAILIANYNDVVGENDEVFILGDVSFGNLESTLVSCALLNGRKHLILGNHDKIIKKNIEQFKNVFVSINDYLNIRVNNQRISMFHFPIESWDCQHHGAYHLHGHCHGSLKQSKSLRRFDCGVDNRQDNKMIPFSFEEIDSMLGEKPFKNMRKEYE